MQTQVILTSNPNALTMAVDVLMKGGLVAFPTDTVYGLGAWVWSTEGIERLYEAKGRDQAKAIPVLIGEMDQLIDVTLMMSQTAHHLAERLWPGALTIVVPKRPDLPANLSPTETVGVRMPDHADALALLQRSGALAVTSANLSGGENPLTAQDVLAQLDGRIELVLDGGKTPGGVPSTVVDCSGEEMKVLRQGPFSLADLTAVLEN